MGIVFTRFKAKYLFVKEGGRLVGGGSKNQIGIPKVILCTLNVSMNELLTTPRGLNKKGT
jgi:hypothetical protein